MKKIFNIVLALAVVSIFASCKAQEVYFNTPEANDFEFGDQVVVKVTTNIGIHGLGYGDRMFYSKKADGSLELAKSSDVAYLEKVTYRTFIPIVEDTTNGGYFSYAIQESNQKDSDVKVGTYEGGIMVYWQYADNEDGTNGTPYDNEIKGSVKDKNGNPYYNEDGSEVKWGAGYKKPIVNSVKFKVVATDKRNGANQITKEITVNHSTNSTKEIVRYDEWW